MSTGSRNAPSADAAFMVAPTPDQVREITWLSSITGCALPTPFASAAAPASSAADASSSSPDAASSPSSTTPPLLRVSLTDGRTYTGELQCIDSHSNLILMNGNQELGEIDGVKVGGYAVGQILIAWKLVQKVEMKPQKQLKKTEPDN